MREPQQRGPHGLSEILYAFFSAAGNNGSAFAGLNANTVFYNLTLGFVMLIGRFVTIVPALAVAGSLAAKKRIPASSATFPTASALFAVMLAAVVVIVGALTFFPALVLGPVLDHLLSGGPDVLGGSMKEKKSTIWRSGLMGSAVAGAFRRLDPRLLWRNPVMFVVECVSVVTTVISVEQSHLGRPLLVQRADQHLALVYRTLCQLRRGPCRRQGKGAGRDPAAGPRARHMRGG